MGIGYTIDEHVFCIPLSVAAFGFECEGLLDTHMAMYVRGTLATVQDVV